MKNLARSFFHAFDRQAEDCRQTGRILIARPRLHCI